VDHFTIVEDACAIIYSRGYYSQVDVYQRGENYYAKVGSKYVRLMPYSQTSVPSIRWHEGSGFDTTLGRRERDVRRAA
jgi:hypothetical protein